MIRRVAVALTVGFVATAAAGDVLVLDDGSEIAGDVRRVRDGERDGYEVNGVFVEQSRVARLIVGRDSAEAAAPSGEGLASLRRATLTLDDPAVAVAKYESFLNQSPDEATATLARQDLAEWRSRVERGLVRLGTAWVTPSERDAAADAALAAVDAARQAVAAGSDDAREQADALLLDPLTAVSGHYFLGLLAYDRGDLGEAREQWELVRKQAPQHAPTLTNLAAVQASLGRPERAVWFIAEAASIAPGTRAILDNAVELERLVAGIDRVPNLDRLLRVVAPQEAQLQQSLEVEGWFRWGSGWVDAAQRQAIEAARRAIETEVAALAEQADQLDRQIAAIDSAISANLQAQQALEDASVVREPDGRVRRLPLPPAHQQLVSENGRLDRERSSLSVERSDLQRDIGSRRAAAPSPTYAGRLTPIGPDGVPVMLPTTP